jgi:hypothetical protein
MEDDFFQGTRIRVILIDQVQNSRAVDIFPAMPAGGRLGKGGINSPAAYALKVLELHVDSPLISLPFEEGSCEKIKAAGI